MIVVTSVLSQMTGVVRLHLRHGRTITKEHFTLHSAK